MSTDNFTSAVQTASKLTSSLEQIIRGRTDTIKLVITALFADGHVLLEDYPGSGKTTLSKALGNLVSHTPTPGQEHIVQFRRIQFTPDLLPGDVLGVTVFEPGSGNFRFIHGPVFAHVVLADEINRTGPKVQAAFLECMAEKQVTIDNVTYPLDPFFFVLGTQNPLDIAGTYPLPQVQLDRFLFKIPMPYVDAKTEVQILEDHSDIKRSLGTISPVCTRHDILAGREAADSVRVSAPVRDAIVDIVQETRVNPAVHFGASTRAALMLQSAVKAWALVNGRDYVTEDDLKQIAPYVLLHRLRFHGGVGNPREALLELMAPHLERLISRAA